MSRLDYCKNELIGHSCYDWEHNRCDMCNIFKAYCEGARRAKESQVEAPKPTGELISRADAIALLTEIVFDEPPYVSDDEWGDVVYDNIIAWMPLPKPYREDGEV